MVIYLPLLFAEGQPTSLDRITLHQAVKFIPFMLQCCPEYSTEGPPDWWPPNIPYKFPLSSSPASKGWLTQLKQLIIRCYEYHKSEHVLRFCSRLAQMPPHHLKYKDSSHQGFVSIYNKTNEKLIVTFKKKNQVYDKPATNTSPFKKIFVWKPAPPGPQHIEDIYLCNYCDEEFSNAKDAIAHEAECKGDEEVQNVVDQVSVMRVLGLAPCDPKAPAVTPGTKRGTSVRLTARSYMQIPITSPLGMKMSLNVPSIRDADKMESLQKYEACCKSYVMYGDNSRKYRKPRQSFRSFKKRQIDQWTHSYCFNRVQKAERKLTIRTGLNKRARALLKRCKTARVLVERLPLLDPLAIHAAASLQANLRDSLPGPSCRRSEAEQQEQQQSFVPQTNASATAICIDLTIDSDDSDDSDSRSSFFSSDHERPCVSEWRHPLLSTQCLILPKC